MYKGMTLGANVVDENSTATAAGTPPENPGSIDFYLKDNSEYNLTRTAWAS